RHAPCRRTRRGPGPLDRPRLREGPRRAARVRGGRPPRGPLHPAGTGSSSLKHDRAASATDNERVERLNIVSAENTDGRIDVGHVLGSSETLMFIYDLAPGQSSSPYHYEYDEEWLLVVDGTIVGRTPHGEQHPEAGALPRLTPTT